MFVLSRRIGEAIRIGDIRVVVTRISGKQVRLGFKTPTGLRAYRAELYAAIEADNRAAQRVTPQLLDYWTKHDNATD